MIFGSVAYLGSFNRKSAVSTAGTFTFTVSSPPSISLVTDKSPFVFSTFDANVACKIQQHKLFMYIHKNNLWNPVSSVEIQTYTFSSSKYLVIKDLLYESWKY